MNPSWKRPALQSTSSMMGRAWLLPTAGRVTMGSARLQDLTTVDQSWPSMRPDADPATGWVWYDIGVKYGERFSLSADDGGPLALWAGARAGVEMVEGRPCYRIERIEVHPQKRGVGIGSFTMALIAKRAIELGAEALVLEAVTEQRTVDFYERLGGVSGGWSPARGLIPFSLSRQAVARLVEEADDHEA